MNLNPLRMSFVLNPALFSLCYILAFSCSTSSGISQKTSERIPDAETLMMQFPESEYIAFRGTGENEVKARNASDAALSEFLNAKISSSRTAEERFYSREKNGLLLNSNTMIFNDNTEIFSENDVTALRHSNVYFDSKRGEYFICAYINRNEAWQNLRPELISSSGSFENYYELAQKEDEPFKKVLAVLRAEKSARQFYNSYFKAHAVCPQKIAEFNSIDKKIQKAETEFLPLKKSFVMYIDSTGDENEIVKAKISEIFSLHGFVITDKGSYKISVKNKIQITQENEIYLSSPESEIFITDKNGTALFSCTSRVNKAAAYTKESAQRISLNKLLNKIEEDLKGFLSGEY